MYYNIKLKTITLKISEPEPTLDQVSDSAKSIEIAKAICKDLEPDQEHFSVLFLNQQNKINGFKTLFSGSITSAMVDPRIIFRNALLFGAVSIILVHNHPSGTATPSEDDKSNTKEIIKAGRLLKIHVLDHIIIGNNTGQSFSFAQNGLIVRYNMDLI